MRKTEDTLTRARRALSQVDLELDLTRTRSDALVRVQPDPAAQPEPEPDDASSAGVEILRYGERPTLPRRRSAVWALVATVALLGGAGTGTALLWPEPNVVLPGAPASLAPTPSTPTSTPSTRPSLGPRECASSPPATRATPEPDRPGQPSDSLPPDGCDVAPSPSSSVDGTGP